jgi:hypothetical protein
LGPCAPRHGLPVLERLPRQHRIGPLHRAGWPRPRLTLKLARMAAT